MGRNGGGGLEEDEEGRDGGDGKVKVGDFMMGRR